MPTVDWQNRIIHVARNELNLVQSNPIEIREMDLNWFRLSLKALEASETGMPFLDTHFHQGELTMGGITFARIIVLINGYTVTFEDGQYAVNLLGANSNVADYVNVNQVSVRSANSAGMTSSPDIEFGAYGGFIHIDEIRGVSGQIHPTGTPRQKSDNLADTIMIADYRGIDQIQAYGNLLIDNGGDYSGLSFFGESMSKTIFTISPAANVLGCEFYDGQVTGTLDNNATLYDCLITNLNFFNGYIIGCFFEAGTTVLGGGIEAHILNSRSAETGSLPEIDCGGTNQSLVIEDFYGRFLITNKWGPEKIEISLASGIIYLDRTTVTGGDITITGTGWLLDAADDSPILTGTYGSLNINNRLNNEENFWRYNRDA